jgi:hypothetical protein
LEYTLEGDRITLGGRVLQSSGSFVLSAGAIVVDWDGNLRPGTAGSVGTVIEGAGKTSTINLKNNTDFTYFTYFADGAEGRVIFKKMQLADAISSSLTMNVQAGGNIELWDAQLGSAVYPSKSTTKGSIKLRRSTVYPAAASAALTIAAANSTIDVRESESIGGYRLIYDNQAGSTVLLLNSSASGFTANAVYTAVGANTVPTVKNCAFSGAAGSNAINDVASLVEDDAHIDYNIYNRAVPSAIANAGGSHSQTMTDPLFVSSTDLHLQPSSPAINAGAIITGIHDQATPAIDGNGTTILTIPDIGMDEYDDQRLYFNASAADGGNGTRQYPYNAWTDYVWDGYNLREGAEIKFSGNLGNLDISGLTDDTSTIKIRPWQRSPMMPPSMIMFNHPAGWYDVTVTRIE